MSFLTQAFALITSPAGTATYHILTFFALQAAFGVALGHLRSHGSASGSARLAIAAGLAGVARLALFIVGGLDQSGLIPGNAILPPLDRAIALLTYVLIGWAIILRPGRRLGDALAALATVGVFILFAISIALWYPLGLSGEVYNPSDALWEISKAAVLSLILLALVIFRLNDWGIGLGFTVTLLVGVIIHLTDPIITANYPLANHIFELAAYSYPAPERIAEMAAFPLFAILIYRHAFSTPLPPPAAQPRPERGQPVEPAPETRPAEPLTPAPSSIGPSVPFRVTLSSQAASALAYIAVGSSENDFAGRVTEAVGRTLLADYTMLLGPPTSGETITCGDVFDLIREQHLPGFTIMARKINTVVSAMNRGRPARLRWDSHQNELLNLAQAINVPQGGPAILVPFSSADEAERGQILGGLLVMSAFSQKEWTADDHTLLASIAKPLAKAIANFDTKSRTTSKLLEELDEAARTLNEAQADSRAAQERAARLAYDLEAARAEVRRQTQQVEGLTAVIQGEAPKDGGDDALSPNEIAALRGQYRRSLEELASLNDQLSQTQTELERLRRETDEAEAIHADTVAALNAQIAARQDTLDEQLASAASPADVATLLSLQIDRDRALHDLAEVRAELEELRQRRTAPLGNEELEIARAEIEKLTTELAAGHSAAVTVAALQTDLERAQRERAENEKFAADLAAGHAAITGLQTELERAERELAEAQAEIEKLNAAPPAGPVAESAPDLTALSRELAEARAEIVHLRSQLQSAPIDAPAALRSQAAMLLSLIQDMRQPISSIVGYTDLLLGESVGIIGALQRNFLERVKASAERLNATIEDLVSLAAIDSGTLSLQEQNVEVVDVIEDAFTSVGTQFREKGISLRMDIADDIPPVAADRDAILQIISRLLTNACAASGPNSEVTLTARSQTDGFLLVSVTDTGGGIQEGDLNKVFTRIYRADRPLIEGLGDTGVGLSIAKALAEAQGGRIWVDSQTGVGSTFSVVLPTNGHH